MGRPSDSPSGVPRRQSATDGRCSLARADEPTRLPRPCSSPTTTWASPRRRTRSAGELRRFLAVHLGAARPVEWRPAMNGVELMAFSAIRHPAAGTRTRPRPSHWARRERCRHRPPTTWASRRCGPPMTSWSSGAARAGASRPACSPRPGRRCSSWNGEWLDRTDPGADHLRNHRLPVHGDSTSPEGHPRAVVGAGRRRERGGRPMTALPEQCHHRRRRNPRVRRAGVALHARRLPHGQTYGVPEGSRWRTGRSPTTTSSRTTTGSNGSWAWRGGSPGPRPRGGYPMAPFPPCSKPTARSAAAADPRLVDGPVPLLDQHRATRRTPRRVCAAGSGRVPVPGRRQERHVTPPSCRAPLRRARTCSAAPKSSVSPTTGGRPRRRRRARRSAPAHRAGRAARSNRAAALAERSRQRLGRRLPAGPHLRRRLRPLRRRRHRRHRPGPVDRHPSSSSHGNDGIIGGGLLANEFVKLPALFYAMGAPAGRATGRRRAGARCRERTAAPATSWDPPRRSRLARPASGSRHGRSIVLGRTRRPSRRRPTPRRPPAPRFLADRQRPGSGPQAPADLDEFSTPTCILAVNTRPAPPDVRHRPNSVHTDTNRAGLGHRPRLRRRRQRPRHQRRRQPGAHDHGPRPGESADLMTKS